MTVRADLGAGYASVKARPRWFTGWQALGNPALSWLVPLMVLGLWWVSSTAAWISPQTLPEPGRVFETGVRMVDSGEAWQHLSISLQRVSMGFAVGAGAGLLLGMGMGLSRTVRELLYPSFRMLACVPLLGWLPLCILLLGIDELLKVVLIAKAAVIPVTLNTYQGVRAVPAQYLELARVYRFSPLQTVSRVMLPAAFPLIWSGLRYGLSHCWLVLVLVELLASSEGLGYLMSNGQQLMQMDVLLVAASIVGAVGFALDRILEACERYLLRWRPRGFA